MVSKLLFNLILISAFVCLSLEARAQRGSDNAPDFQGQASACEQPRKRNDDSNALTEARSKWCIKAAEKEYKALVERGAEVAKIGEELNKIFIQNQKLSAQDTEKLSRLEKLSKKIRSLLGGKDDDDKEKDGEDLSPEKPKNLEDAIKKLAETSTDLHESLKKSTRHAISATSIADTNYLLELIVFIRQIGGIQTAKQ